MNTDPISDLLTRLRNASAVSKNVIVVPCSKIKNEILKVLKAKGYVEDFETIKNGKFEEIKITLKEDSQALNIKRVSKPGQRIYVKSGNIPKVLGGLGTAIISTQKGMLTDTEARKNKMGGEIICEIY
ncbi:TPA: 30S ribosomal protein S8 [Candidatus Peregrinibacteria bacterium]|nr:30S ribosomal protein S8 [Candidatus Peregrinibacteria bacterium]